MGVIALKWIFLSLMFCSFVACSCTKDREELKGTQWKLETLHNKQVALADSGTVMFIQFDVKENRVSGRAACNRFFGDFELKGAMLKFLPMAATRMVCADAQKELEFFQMLGDVDGFQIKDDQLSFLSQKKVIATFQKMTKKQKTSE